MEQHKPQIPAHESEHLDDCLMMLEQHSADLEASRKKAAAKKATAQKSKRKTGKLTRRLQVINTAACFLMIFAVAGKLAVTKRAHGYLQSENRNIAEFPEFSLRSYFSGEYTDGIVNYYTDSIPNREGLRNIANKFTGLFGIHTGGVEIIGNAGTVDQEPEQAAVTTAAQTVTAYTGTRATTVTEATVTTEAIQTKKRTEVPADGEIVNSSVIITGKGTPNVRAMPMFSGRLEKGRRYAELLNQYKEMVGDQVNIYNMSVPLASAYYAPTNMADQFSNQHDCINNIAASLKNVINVDVYDTLEQHADEYIYFRTDHHWQPLGAYYAAQQFAETAGVPFAELSTFEECVTENYTGSMYGYANYLEDLKTYPDTFTYYKPQNEYTITYYDESFSNPKDGTLFVEYEGSATTYSTILGGDLNIAEIKTDVGNGRTLVLIKNSYGNALVPFFVGSFERIYVVDFRYVKIGMNDFFNRVGATDVLFGMAMSSCYTTEHIDAMQEIMY